MGGLSIGAGVILGAAILLLWRFFQTGDTRMDRLAEVGFVVFAVLAAPTILAVGERFGDDPVRRAATIGGVAGVVVLGLGELGSLLGLLDFRRIGAIVGLAFVVFLGWIGVTSAGLLDGESLPAGLGWLGLGSIVVGVSTIVPLSLQTGREGGDTVPSGRRMLFVLLPIAGVVAWLIWLGLALG